MTGIHVGTYVSGSYVHDPLFHVFVVFMSDSCDAKWTLAGVGGRTPYAPPPALPRATPAMWCIQRPPPE